MCRGAGKGIVAFARRLLGWITSSSVTVCGILRTLISAVAKALDGIVKGEVDADVHVEHLLQKAE